jgi:hypothetical protein
MRPCGWYPVKVLCAQEVVSTSLVGVSYGIATLKASAPQGPWCVLGVWLQSGVREDVAWSKPIAF